MINMNLQEHIDNLIKLRDAVAGEVTAGEQELQEILTKGKEKSSQVEAKREKWQKLVQAVMNLQEYQTMAKGPEVLEMMTTAIDPWA